MQDLDASENGVSFDSETFNSFAYADDITLICATVPGLQNLINICTTYAETWRFNFNIKKSKCIIVGDHKFVNDPQWLLKDGKMDNVDELSILGTIFTADNKGNVHVDHRIKKCRGAFYNFTEVGMCYPGLSSNVKAHIWRTVCLPSLIYGCDARHITSTDVKKMDTVQGNLIKQVMGLSKRSHSTHLLAALNIPSVKCTIKKSYLSLLGRIFQTDSPCLRLCSIILARYIQTGCYNNDTLIGTIINMGMSPVKVAFQYNKGNTIKGHQTYNDQDGVTDSIKYLIMQEHFLKPYSDEHVLVKLLTKAF